MQLSRYTTILPLCFFALLLILGSCKKESTLDSGGDLRFSTDTLTFDTVFTAQGSFTLSVKIFNPQDQKVNISSVKLEKGTASFFHLNVDGFPGNNVTNLELAAHDSLYVFATVNIDPTNADNPFVIEDKLIATMNGKEFSIPVIAYGQNAHYIVDSVLKTDTWLTDKPYVIIHNALVDAGQTLTIPPKCRIYMHADSRLLVDGTLIADAGQKQDSIVFQGDRLDRAYFGYRGYPGEWGGLYFTANSTNNVLNFVTLKNCGASTTLQTENGPATFLPAAIQVNGSDALGTTNQITIRHTTIENAFGYGILSFQGNMVVENTIVHNTGSQALAILQGGNYTFRNCSFINYYPTIVSHIDDPSVAVFNYYDTTGNGKYRIRPLTANFTNCLIYGTLDEELICDQKDTIAAPYHASFDHCLIKSSQDVKLIPGNVVRTACIFNQDPQFNDYAKWDFRAKNNAAPTIDAGGTNLTTGNDLDDKPRVVGSAIDIGCFEFQ